VNLTYVFGSHGGLSPADANACMLFPFISEDEVLKISQVLIFPYIDGILSCADFGSIVISA